MAKRADRPKSLIPLYMYRGQERPPAFSRINVRNVLVWAMGLVLIGLVGWLYLLQASQVAAYAHEIRTLQMSKERIHRQNTVLTGQVAELGSLERIHRTGEQLGYSLAQAGDTARRMALIYEPLPTPVPTYAPDNGGASGGAQAETGRGPNLFERLKAQMDAWLRTAQPAAEGE